MCHMLQTLQSCSSLNDDLYLAHVHDQPSVKDEKHAYASAHQASLIKMIAAKLSKISTIIMQECKYNMIIISRDSEEDDQYL